MHQIKVNKVVVKIQEDHREKVKGNALELWSFYMNY